MKITSFDSDINKRISRDIKQDNLFNLFQKNLVNVPSMPLRVYVVPREYEMRLDRISNHIYGSPNYVEELMILNDIINPYSVKEGQYIYFCQYENLSALQVTDELLTNNETLRQQLITSSQSTKNKQNLTVGDQNLPLTIKPYNLEQIKVGQDNKVQIINSFE